MSALADAWDMLTTASNWTGDHGFLARTRAHVWISVVATAIATLLAIPPAIWLAHRRLVPGLSVAAVNLSRAIPSFAIVALVLPFSIRYGFGLGFWPTCVALVALAIPPIFTNTYAGVAGTPPELVEAARGLGMTGREVLRHVELPTSIPLVLTGIRVSAVQVIATATLGAIVGYECLGTYIVAGLQRGQAGQAAVLSGAFLVAALALLADAAFGRVEPRCAPWLRRVR